jgi:hypothetical protein
MAYARVSVKKNGANPGRPTGKAGYIILFDWSQVKTYTRDDKGVKVSAFEMQGEEKPIAVYATDSTQNVYHQSAGNDDARGFIQHADFSHPGDSLEFNEFVENNVNGRLGAIFVPCSGTDCRIAGLPCNPLKMTQDNGQNNAEGTKHDVQLVQSFAGPALGHIDKSLVPATADTAVNAELGLPVTGSDGEGI